MSTPSYTLNDMLRCVYGYHENLNRAIDENKKDIAFTLIDIIQTQLAFLTVLTGENERIVEEMEVVNRKLALIEKQMGYRNAEVS